MNPLLSILIPTTPDRLKDVSKLLECIRQQANTSKVDKFEVKGITATRYWDLLSEVEVLVFEDAKIMTIGEKRELLYKHAKGIYSWQIDSDDSIAQNAIQLILEAIKSNHDVDCITFQENCQMNGKYYKSNHSLEYPDWYGDGSHILHDGFHYHRTPFYKDVIKTEIAKSVPFKHIRYGEDHLWSIDLKPHLKTEIHIDRELYYYIYEPKDTHEQRYGIE